MSTLSVQIIGLEDFIADTQRAGINAKSLISAALQNSAVKIQSNIRERAPHRTGALQRSILTTVSYPTAMVSSQEPYASYVEYGTAPHIIAPKNKKALYWNGAASPYRIVHHPGTKANPFFSAGVTESEAYVYEQFMQVVKRLVSTMAGVPV
jgi:HK97 gp10 family phage protein